MELKLLRKEFKPTQTAGNFSVNGSPMYYTCEDKDRGLNSAMSLDEIKRIKVKAETAIPAGRYKIAWVYWASHKRYAPLLLNVPGFQGIFIHSGNTEADSEGCILIGFNKITSGISNSKAARIDLDKRIETAIKNGEEVYITIERAEGFKLAV